MYTGIERMGQLTGSPHTFCQKKTRDHLPSGAKEHHLVAPWGWIDATVGFGFNKQS